MKKSFLLIFSVIFVLMGFMAIIQFPFGPTMFIEPVWHSWVKIIIGIIGLFVAFTKDK